MNKISSQIENHNFIKELVSDLQPFPKKLPPDKDYTPSEIERYTVSVFKWAGRIMECFVTLEHARAYVSYFRANKHYTAAGIGRSYHINYHYFNYAITVVRIMDVALILTNTTFRLGNPERLCRLDNIGVNSWCVQTGVDELLKKLNSIVEPWREPRNLFIHRGETLDISRQRQDSRLLYLLEADDILSRQDEPVTILSSIEARLLYRPVVSGIFKEFDQTEKPLLETTSQLLLGLLPIYKFWRKMLTQTPSD